jgi:hypothetical protein
MSDKAGFIRIGTVRFEGETIKKGLIDIFNVFSGFIWCWKVVQ